MREFAVAVIEDGRWIWTNAEHGAAMDHWERNEKRSWRRKGYPPITCGCEISVADVRAAITSLRHLWAREASAHGGRAMPESVQDRIERVVLFCKAAAGSTQAAKHLSEVWTLVESVRHYLLDRRDDELDVMESYLGVLEDHLHADGILTEWQLADRTIHLIDLAYEMGSAKLPKLGSDSSSA